MFNLRPTEDCDQDKNDLFKQLTELNDDDLDLENLVNNKEINNRTEIDENEEESEDDELNNVNNSNLKINHQDDDYQYLLNEQIILNSKDLIGFANQNLHEFLLYDKERLNLNNDKSNTDFIKRKPKFCDNVNNNQLNSTTTCSNLNNSNCINNNSTSSSSNQLNNKSQQQNSSQQLNILNFKSSIFDRNKRKLIKLMLKLKDEEKNENNELNCFQIRKDCQLLPRYIREEKLSHLILKLFPNNQGYTISLKKIYDKNQTKNSTIQSTIKVLETIKLPYEENELLDFIDNEQIPPILLDILDSNCEDDEHLDLFHFGKLFIEIQDYRKNFIESSSNNLTNLNYDSKFVLLKPTVQTLLNDVDKLTNFNATRNWTENDKLDLESKLVFATSEPICLDPNPITFLTSNQLNYERKWLNNDRIKNICKKSSQSYINKIEKFSQLPAPKSLELFDFIKKKYKGKHVDVAMDKVNKRVNDYMFVKDKNLTAPKTCLEDVLRHSKRIEIPIRNDNSLTKLEEYVMEYTEQTQRPCSTTSISIFYRQIDDTYYGQLNLEKNSKLMNYNLSPLISQQTANQSSSGSSCLFKLGNKLLTKKYIEQFIEILSEHGKKCIKITTKKPGQQPHVNYTKKLITSNLNNNVQNQINNQQAGIPNSCNIQTVNVQNPPIKKIKVTNSNAIVNGSIVNINHLQQNYNTNELNYNASNLNSSINSNLNISNSSLINLQCNKPSTTTTSSEVNQHPILTSNLMQNNHLQQTNLINNNLKNETGLPMQNIVINNTMNQLSNSRNESNSINNDINSLNSTNLINSNNSGTNDQTPPIIICKSPYAQMSILEKNSNQQLINSNMNNSNSINNVNNVNNVNNNIVNVNHHQVQHQQIQHQQQQSNNNLIANNPILNNLITNNTISTNLVQNNFIQLSNTTKAAKNISISNGYIQENTTTATMITNQQQQPTNQQQLNNSSNQTYLEANNLNPITLTSPITSLNRLNSGKSETVAVILTTNQLPNSTNTNKTNSIIQINNSGQANSSTANLPAPVVNLSTLGRGQNLRLHNLVSLANTNHQCIAVPIFMMASNSPNSNQTNLNTNGNTTTLMNTATIMNTGNVVVTGNLQQDGTIKSDQNTNQQNVVLINSLNNLDHHTNQPQQITYQPQTQFTIGSLSRLTTNQLTATNIQTSTPQNTTNLTTHQQSNDTIIDQVDLNQFTNLQNSGPIAIHLTTTNPINETQPAAIHTNTYNTHSM